LKALVKRNMVIVTGSVLVVISVRWNQYCLQGRIVVEGSKHDALGTGIWDSRESVVEAEGILCTWDSMDALLHATFLFIRNGKNTVLS
jgi:hypothetical protein